METSQSEKQESCCRHHRHGSFWGIVLVALGLVFLADNLGWVCWDLPFWPVVMIIGGAYLIYTSGRREKQ